MNGFTESTRPRLLVVGTGSRPYREYLLASIAPHYRVHLLIGHEADWERRYVEDWSVLDFEDTVDGEQMILAAKQAASQAPFDGVLTWDEARVLQAAKVAQSLQLPGGDPEMALRCRDKHLTRIALSEAAVPQPRSVMVSSPAQALSVAAEIGYPVVLKPRAMAASLGVVRVDDPEQLAAQFDFARDTTVPGAWHYDQVLVEEYLAGEEISVDAAVHHGQVLPLFVARKQVGYPPYFEEIGHSVTADDPLLDDPALRRVLQAAHDALAFTDGMTHTELKLTSSGPKVVEVNARLGGDLIPYLGQRATGVDPGVVAAAVACGTSPSITRTRSRSGAVRFFYVEEPDTTISEISFAALDCLDCPALDLAAALAEPGDVLSPPPAGTTFGRAAYVTAVADTEAECAAALDAAERALVIRGR
ncbi:MAG: ATP-grasp domain-containing protein [Jatrophihabitantaceae bacterium]